MGVQEGEEGAREDREGGVGVRGETGGWEGVWAGAGGWGGGEVEGGGMGAGRVVVMVGLATWPRPPGLWGTCRCHPQAGAGVNKHEEDAWQRRRWKAHGQGAWGACLPSCVLQQLLLRTQVSAAQRQMVMRGRAWHGVWHAAAAAIPDC